MMRKISSLLLAILMLAALTIPAWADSGPELYHITDDVGLLTDEQWYDLETRAEDISAEYQCEVYIVVVDDYERFADSMKEAAKYIFEAYNLGYGEEKVGHMLFLAMDTRQYWLLAHGGPAHEAFTDYGKEQLAQVFVDDFGDDDWYTGFSDFLDESAYYLDMAEQGEPVDVPKRTAEDVQGSYGLALIIGLVTAFIVCGVFKRQMNTARTRSTASEYIAPNGVTFTNRIDHYTHTTTTRRKLEKESSSSGGGGGTTVDDDGYSGSGGSF